MCFRFLNFHCYNQELPLISFHISRNGSIKMKKIPKALKEQDVKVNKKAMCEQ